MSITRFCDIGPRLAFSGKPTMHLSDELCWLRYPWPPSCYLRNATSNEENSMSDIQPAAQFHTNRCSADAACAHCGGIIRHERWCITRDPVVYYAYQIVADPSRLTPGDALILHSLGVSWEENACTGKCKV